MSNNYKRAFPLSKIEADIYETPLKEDKDIAIYNDVYAIKQSDYNKLADSFTMKQLFMDDNEAYVLTGTSVSPYSTNLSKATKESNYSA